MAKLFGGKDPFDHPFFTHPFGGLFDGKNPFDDPFFTGPYDYQPRYGRQITIEELNPDNDDRNAVQKEDMSNKELTVKNRTDYASGPQSFCYQRVAYEGLDGVYYSSSMGKLTGDDGRVAYEGLDGVYYSSSMGKLTGDDGLVLMEMKEEDKIAGESLHTLSKGIRDKGHSVTTKQSSDGKVDSLQTLHNLNEDELDGFEDNWKSTAEKKFPGWNNGFNLLENAGSNMGDWNHFPDWSSWGGWSFPLLEYFGDAGEPEPNTEAQGSSSRGRSRKVVPVE